MTGPVQICISSNQSYSLSPALPANWTITSGASLVSMSVINPTTTGPTLTNSGSNGTVVLNANIYGCRDVYRSITIGLPTWEGPIVNEPDNVCTNASLLPGVVGYPAASGYDWTMVIDQGPSSYYLSGVSTTVDGLTLYSEGHYRLEATAHSTCGDMYLYKDFYATNCWARSTQHPKSNEKTRVKNEGDQVPAIVAFPNPADEEVTVSLHLPAKMVTGMGGMKDQRIVNVQLINMHGAVVRSKPSVANGNIKMDIKRLPAGHYIVRITGRPGKPVYTQLVIDHSR